MNRPETPRERERRERREQTQLIGTLGSALIEGVLGPIVGYYGGDWIDRRFGTGPWFRTIGLCLGLFTGGRALYRAYRRAKAELDKPTK